VAEAPPGRREPEAPELKRPVSPASSWGPRNLKPRPVSAASRGGYATDLEGQTLCQRPWWPQRVTSAFGTCKSAKF
jgi:hypothetical protein